MRDRHNGGVKKKVPSRKCEKMKVTDVKDKVVRMNEMTGGEKETKVWEVENKSTSNE